MKIIKLDINRVRRNYLGGRNLDEAQGVKNPSVSNKPEEWVCSITEARNPGLEVVENEGLSTHGGKLLIETIKENPEYYLGKELYEARGIDLGFLMKVLDSSMRLHVQAHPTREYAIKYLNSNYGKLECYYILSTRGKSEGYLRLGFQHLKDKEEWMRIVNEQDIAAMDALFDKIPVHVGETWYIPGGMPHAIGEDIAMIEIMEPSDLVLRCEFEREGIVVPPQARFMGKSLEDYVDIFDCKNRTKEEICALCKLEEKEVSPNRYLLVDTDKTKTFRVFMNKISGDAVIEKGLPRAVLATEGSVTISTKDGEEVKLDRWESAMLSFSIEDYIVRGEGKLIEVQSAI